jgi:hypothetical protein
MVHKKMTNKSPTTKVSCRTKKAISITLPEDLLVILEDERHPKESRSRAITRLIMKGLELPDEDYLVILELRRKAKKTKKTKKPTTDESKETSTFHGEEPL